MLTSGTVLSDRYELLEKIGSGGMAIVFRGRDRTLERYVTVKILREEFIGDEEFIRRFRSEALAAAKLSHPNIVRVYDVGQDGTIYFIVMEYIHGDTLKQAIKEKAPFDTKSTINVAIQIASAISQAHKNHIIHRDIKPQNILVSTDGMAKVTDFGIARAANGATVATTNTAMGSVHYFSPEQARGGYVDEKSDIYSLGITMFEMVTGQLPFQANTSVAVAMKQINEELPDIRQYNPKVSASLEAIIRKATRKKADERYATIDAMIEDLMKARTESNGSFVKQNLGQRPPQRQTPPPPQKNGSRQPEIQYLSTVDNSRKQAEMAARRMEQEVEPPLEQEERPMPRQEKPMGKGLRISKDDEYEREYEEVEPVKRSRRPKLDMQQRRNPRQEEDYDNYDRRQERKVMVAAVVTALVIIAIISAIGVKAFGTKAGLFGSSSDEKLPSFQGMTLEQAQEMAEKDGYRVLQEKEAYSNTYRKGMITEQSVAAGTEIKEGMEVGVTISLGTKEEEEEAEVKEEKMPNLVGKDRETAEDTIKELIGKEPSVRYVFDEKAEEDTIIEQKPEAGEIITSATRIEIVCSKGKETRTAIVPSVEGLTQAKAEKSLIASKLKVGNITETESDTVAKGIVITQTKSTGDEVPEGTEVGLVVSLGSGTTETPIDTTEPTDTTTEAPPTTQGNKTKTYTINPPAAGITNATVKIVKTDDNGETVVMEEQKSLPFSVPITGSGDGQIICYIDGVQMWTAPF